MGAMSASTHTVLQFLAGVILFCAISAMAACSTPFDTDWGGMSYVQNGCKSTPDAPECKSKVIDTISAVGKSNR